MSLVQVQIEGMGMGMVFCTIIPINIPLVSNPSDIIALESLVNTEQH